MSTLAKSVWSKHDSPVTPKVLPVDGEEKDQGHKEGDHDLEHGTLAHPPIHGRTQRKTLEKNLASIFLFQSPAMYFRAVEALLLFQCFYISLVATQLIPMATKIGHNLGGFIVGFIIPILFIFYVIQLTLNKTVLLRAVFELEREIAGKVVEFAKEEKVAVKKMKDAVFQKLNDEEIPPEEWNTFLKEYFFR